MKGLYPRVTMKQPKDGQTVCIHNNPEPLTCKLCQEGVVRRRYITKAQKRLIKALPTAVVEKERAWQEVAERPSVERQNKLQEALNKFNELIHLISTIGIFQDVDWEQSEYIKAHKEGEDELKRLESCKHYCGLVDGYCTDCETQVKSKKKRGDWICIKCRATNFGSEERCYNCKEPRGHIGPHDWSWRE